MSHNTTLGAGGTDVGLCDFDLTTHILYEDGKVHMWKVSKHMQIVFKSYSIWEQGEESRRTSVA